MKNKKFFIHVGLPKTGTTYVQRYIFPKLNNIHYLDITKKPYSILFRDIFYNNFITGHSKKKIKESLRSYLKNITEEIILISDEAWFGGALGGSHYNFSNNYYLTNLLKEFFPNAKIILTIRRQDKWLESMYKHLLRDGYYLTVKEFLNYHNNEFHNYISYFRKGPNIDIKTLNYKAYIENYEDLFGKKNILILQQESLIKDRKIFLKNICDFLQIPHQKNFEFKNKRANSGYLYLGGNIARILNRFFIYEGKEGGFLPTTNIKLLNYRTYLRLLDKLFPTKRTFISSEMKKKILEYHSLGNKEIDLKYQLELKKYQYYE